MFYNAVSFVDYKNILSSHVSSICNTFLLLYKDLFQVVSDL